MSKQAFLRIFDSADTGGLSEPATDAAKDLDGLTPAGANKGKDGARPRLHAVPLVDSSSNRFFENLADGVTVQELARELRVAPKTIYDWIYRRRIPAWCILRINGRVPASANSGGGKGYFS